MKRDLLFVTERLAAVLDERRLAIIFRLHGIGKANGAGDAPAKLLASFLRKADESTIGRVLVAITVLQAAHSPNESAKALREAAFAFFGAAVRGWLGFALSVAFRAACVFSLAANSCLTLLVIAATSTL